MAEDLLLNGQVEKLPNSDSISPAEMPISVVSDSVKNEVEQDVADATDARVNEVEQVGDIFQEVEKNVQEAEVKVQTVEENVQEAEEKVLKVEENVQEAEVKVLEVEQNVQEAEVKVLEVEQNVEKAEADVRQVEQDVELLRENVETLVQDANSSKVGNVMDLFLAAAIIVAAIGLHLVMRKVFKENYDRVPGWFQSKASFFVPLLLWIITPLLVTSVLGINLNTFANVLVAGGLIIGLIITPAGSNAVAGVLNALNDSFRVGETIKVNGELGVVKRRGTMTTEISSPKGIDIQIPNKVLFDQVVRNYTRIPFYRFETTVFLNEDVLADDAQNVIQGVLDQGSWDFKVKETGDSHLAFCRLAEEEPHALVFHVYGFVRARLDAPEARYNLNLQIRRALEQADMVFSRNTVLATDKIPLYVSNASPQTTINSGITNKDTKREEVSNTDAG